jgi:hypothetical protein
MQSLPQFMGAEMGLDSSVHLTSLPPTHPLLHRSCENPPPPILFPYVSITQRFF